MTGAPPLPDNLTIPSDKASKYLLNPDHPKGGSKAKFFLHFGFSPDRLIEFADAIFAQAMGARSFKRCPTSFGLERIECIGPVWTPSGRKPWIRTVWLVTDPETASLVTVVPDREPRSE